MCDAAVDRMGARFFLAVGIGHRVAAIDATCRLDRATGQQQRFKQRGLARAGVTGERDIADLFGAGAFGICGLASDIFGTDVF
jgi:hypothetical protein